MESQDDWEENKPSRHAAWFPVPDVRIMSIEHPANVVHVDKAVQTLGGAPRVEKLLQSQGKTGLSLRLRSYDPLCPAIDSKVVVTNDVLLKVRAPKKRKRDSENLPDISSNVFERIRECKDECLIEVVGLINRSARFRDMADFQYRHADDPFVKKFGEAITSMDYQKLRSYTISSSAGVHAPNHLLTAPPCLSTTGVPYAYTYEPNSASKEVLDGYGNKKMINMQAARLSKQTSLRWDAKTVPTQFDPMIVFRGINQLLTDDHIKTKDLVSKLFLKRPIWTRRSLYNHLPDHLWHTLKAILPFVGYSYIQGAWKHCTCRFGLDPRKDPACRKYQVIYFQYEVEVRGPRTYSSGARNLSSVRDFNARVAATKLKTDRERNRRKVIDVNTSGTRSVTKIYMSTEHADTRTPPDEDFVSFGGQLRLDEDGIPLPISYTHNFDGKEFVPDGRVFQLADISDPDVRLILDKYDGALRQDCDPVDGWYPTPTMRAIRKIMRAKIHHFLGDSAPHRPDLPDRRLEDGQWDFSQEMKELEDGLQLGSAVNTINAINPFNGQIQDSKRIENVIKHRAENLRRHAGLEHQSTVTLFRDPRVANREHGGQKGSSAGDKSDESAENAGHQDQIGDDDAPEAEGLDAEIEDEDYLDGFGAELEEQERDLLSNDEDQSEDEDEVEDGVEEDDEDDEDDEAVGILGRNGVLLDPALRNYSNK